MRILTGALLIFSFILAGCGKAELEERNKQLAEELKSKDQFIEEATSTINDIHQALESTWAMEKKIVQQTTPAEGGKALSSAELKQSILSRISDMGAALSENRKKIASLDKRLRDSKSQYAGLSKMVDQLKKDLEEREKSIVELQARVQTLEGEVAQKTKIIAAHETTIASHETTIADQRKQLNTVFYVVGSKDELKKKGIITDEGGVLWGLLGSTTVLGSNFDGNDFQSLDRSTKMIEISGTIAEIVPKRDESSYTKEQSQNGRSVLKITNPDSFWRENRLVVLTR